MMETDQSFRDSIATVDTEGKRNFIYPKKPKGKWYSRRKTVSYLLLLLLAAGPFVRIKGNQLFLFNVLERRFNFFGVPFWPQDFYLVVIGMICAVVFVALFTTIYGRLFCGWVCPQTIFMEMVFRRIEYWIDGDRGAQLRLARQEWNGEKIKKRLLKWALFLIVSFLIANIFLAYLVGSTTLVEMMVHGPVKELGSFIALVVFTFVFFFIYVRFREQVCLIVCPYGRLQGVLLDNKSINVAYDFVRGEKQQGRAKFNKTEDRAASGKGDCIDCRQCVNVCPTGIDIRNGTQLECTNCTACIDECDTIMQGVGLPLGLIRYASEDEIERSIPFRMSSRMKAYTAVLCVLLGVFAGLLLLRDDLDVTLLRVPGQLYVHRGDSIRNIYTYRLLNKTSNAYNDVQMVLVSPKGKVSIVGAKSLTIPAGESRQGTLFVDIALSDLHKDKEKGKFEILAGNRKIETETAAFLGPRKFN